MAHSDGEPNPIKDNSPDRGPVKGHTPVKIILRDKEYIARPGSTVRHALQKAGIQPESVLATRNGELITDDEILTEGDVIKLVAVISGGGR